MPQNTIQLSLQTELSLIARDVPSQRTLELVIEPPAAVQSATRSSLNLALVLDRSGSMGGDKLHYVKLAAQHLVDIMDEQDRVAVIAYDDEVTRVSESTPITAESRRAIKSKIQEIHTGGSTNLSEGWLTGCGEVAAHHADGQLERTLLLTDGLANAGIIELEELAMHTRELSTRGVSTSTFGVGRDFNEHLLEAMANAGGGLYHFIASPEQIPEIFHREFNELVTVTAREVEITLEIPAGVAAQVLGAWTVETDGSKLRVFAGALQSGRAQSVYVSLLLPPAAAATEIAIKARLLARGDVNQVLESSAGITFQYADADKIHAAKSDQAMLERSAQVRIAEAANQSLKLERAGEREKAYQNLKLAIDTSRANLPADEVDKYTQMAERMRRGMDEMDRKTSHHTTYLKRQSRDEEQS